MMAVTVLVELHIKADQIDNVRSLFASLLHETRGRDGNLGVTVHQDVDDLLTVILIEKWNQRKSYEIYNRWRMERGDLATLTALLERPPTRRFLGHIGV